MNRKYSPCLLLSLILLVFAAPPLGAEEPEAESKPASPSLTVIESGAEPRLPVRYALKPDFRQTVELLIAVSGSFTTAMGAQEFTFPPVKLTLKRWERPPIIASASRICPLPRKLTWEIENVPNTLSTLL